MDQNPKQQVVERIKSATNILVTVSANPSVDQLAACIGFTLLLNKFGKHATAVFSGAIPSTIEFLQPEKTLETNTDSLQDFIIALDKSKADKLRYKVEDDVVRIFITPYRTSIGQKDLEFSQGDFNVEVVVALGVTKKEDIDQAIMSHGRILHDAVVVSVTDGQNISDVGSINWNDPAASSLSEMLVSISESFQSGLLDGQMSTAFLTGIVAETERFSNAKTSPKVMTMSAQLMAAGANQQLIATELTPPPPPPPPVPAVVEPPVPLASQEPWTAPVAPTADPNAPADASIAVGGEKTIEPITPPPPPLVEEPEKDNTDGEVLIKHHEEQPEPDPVSEDEIHIDEQGNLKKQVELQEQEEAAKKKTEEEAAAQLPAEAIAQAPVGVPSDTASAPDPALPPGEDFITTSPKTVVQPLSAALTEAAQSAQPAVVLPPLDPSVATQPEPTESMIQAVDSLTNLEEAVDSPHLEQAAVQTPNVDVTDARAAVASANAATPYRPEPVQSLGAQYVDLSSSAESRAAAVAPPVPTPAPVVPTESAATLPSAADVLQQASTSVTPDIADSIAPPPVPPPMTPPFFKPTTTHHNPYLNPAAADPNASSGDPTPVN